MVIRIQIIAVLALSVGASLFLGGNGWGPF